MSNHLNQKLEVLLFMARNPLTIDELAQYISATPAEIETSIQELQSQYQASSYGIQIIHVSNGFQFATKPEYTQTLELYINAPQEISLSPAAMETLAIIAYRQPISRGEVEAIRGVNSDSIVHSLLEKALIEEKGKSEAIGKPTLYGTTDAFLKHFGLNSLEDMPQGPRRKMTENKETEDKLSVFSKTISETLNFNENNEGQQVIEPYTIANQ
jgi:segregation and condensation protein B